MEIVEIIKGSSRVLNLRIRDKLTKDPINLTGKVITGKVKGCPTTVDLVAGDFEVVSAVLGSLKLTLSTDHTTAAKEGVIDFEVHLTEGITVQKVYFNNLIEMVKGL